MESKIEKLKKLFGMAEEIEDTDMTNISNINNAGQNSITSAGHVTSSISTAGGGIFTVPLTSPGYTYTVPTSLPSFITSGIPYSMPQRTNIASFNDINGREIVRINFDGSVTWAAGIKIDEAAEAMSRTMTNAVELQAGITKAVKLRMRDSVFEDIIEIAKQKGSLTADDLTYLLEASKIVEKLKGAKD